MEVSTQRPSLAGRILLLGCNSRAILGSHIVTKPTDHSAKPSIDDDDNHGVLS